MKKSIITILQYVFFTTLLPLSFVMLCVHAFKFRNYRTLFINAINTNDEFYSYLEKLNFVPDFLGRLYTIQYIPKEFSDFNDDELYDVTMRSLLPMVKLIETSVLIDVISTVIKRIDHERYIVMLTPMNQNKLIFYIRCSISSLILYCISLLIYVF